MFHSVSISANRESPTPNPAALAINTNSSSPAYQVFRILHVGLVAALILADLDKFFHLWSRDFADKTNFLK
jgi:hypothetical protein